MARRDSGVSSATEQADERLRTVLTEYSVPAPEITQIYKGTNETSRLVIARALAPRP